MSQDHDDNINAVADILAWYLANEPKPYTDVKEHCAKLGITKAELRTARKILNVKTTNTGTTWMWEVPGDRT